MDRFQDIVDAADRQYDNKNTWTDAEVEKRLKQAYGDKKDAVVSEFLKAYPNKKKADALYIDTLIRQPILKIMRRKAHKAELRSTPIFSVGNRRLWVGRTCPIIRRKSPLSSIMWTAC